MTLATCPLKGPIAAYDGTEANGKVVLPDATVQKGRTKLFTEYPPWNASYGQITIIAVPSGSVVIGTYTLAVIWYI